MNNELLIELVRDHKVLYDTSDLNYMKGKLKDEIWTKIGKDLNLKNGNEAKNLWQKLRNCHRDALRRQKNCLKSGAAAVTIKPWRYQKQMQFLVPYMSNRPREGNLEEDSQDEDSQQQIEFEEIADCETESFESKEVTSDIQHEEQIENEENDVVQPSTSGTSLPKNSKERNAKRHISVTEDQSITTTPVPKNKKKQNDDIKEIIQKSMIQRQRRAEERALERAKMVDTQKPLDDDLYHFYMSMYQITKKMPPKFQHLARNNVFQAVAQVEAAYLQIQNPTQQNYHTGQKTFPYYANTHIPQPHFPYSSAPVPSLNPTRSNQHFERQNYSNSSTPLTNSSHSTISPLASPSNIYDLPSRSNSPTTLIQSSQLPAATTLLQTPNTANVRNFLEHFSSENSDI